MKLKNLKKLRCLKLDWMELFEKIPSQVDIKSAIFRIVQCL